LKSKVTSRFWSLLEKLPAEVRKSAFTAYRTFKRNPYHPSLQFKRVSPSDTLYSVRIGLHYRALAMLDNDELTWFWIGSHADYDKLI
jgi:hypothetical protein